MKLLEQGVYLAAGCLYLALEILGHHSDEEDDGMKYWHNPISFYFAIDQ